MDHGPEEMILGDMNENFIKGTRDKTPMCLINDLARFNKISFQYRLTTENGPAHCKRFTVTLKLGDEEYTAEGFKIKKAQHLAAKEAIEKTKYKHPIPKANRRIDDNNVMKSNITPTVELNALAMKLGQQTYYIFDPRQMTSPENNLTQNDADCQLRTNQLFGSNMRVLTSHPVMVSYFGGTFVYNLSPNGKQIQTQNQQRPFLSKFQYRRPTLQPSITNGTDPKTNFSASSPCKITLIVGTKKFVGSGRTLQQAKHDAASNALQVLKAQMHVEQIETNNKSIDGNDHKSPISLVFEMGIKRNLPVDFKVLREEGPAHMRTFTTACIVGDLMTEGEGTGKKISKKKAAQKMLEELYKLPPLTAASSPIKRVKLKTTSKKIACSPPKDFKLIEPPIDEAPRQWNRNKKLTPETDSANPITKLLEWHQNNKEKEPVFKLISEFGKENSRRRQFIIEVSSNNIVAHGVGNSKKLAKRDAAQNLLMAISENDQKSRSGDIQKSSLLAETNNAEKVSNRNREEVSKKSEIAVERNIEQRKNKICTDMPGSTAHEITKNSAIETCSSLSLNGTISKSSNLHMKDQLLYLAKLLGFEVDFSDYPKGNHNEFLTIVMLSTNPPQICHGVGTNSKQSQEDAARNALKILSEMGLKTAVKT